MVNTRMLIIAGVFVGIQITAVNDLENKKDIVDIRKFGLGLRFNQQDERKNTLWHKLAIECKNFEDWSELNERMEEFKQNNKNWLPNPLIENEDGKTAREEAQASYNTTGNPVCGLLVHYLKQTEYNFLNKTAVKASRDMTIIAQKAGLEHPGK